MNNVVTLTPLMTTLDIPVENVLDGAKEMELKKVLVIGINKDDELYAAASFSDAADMIWMMEKVKKYILEEE